MHVLAMSIRSPMLYGTAFYPTLTPLDARNQSQLIRPFTSVGVGSKYTTRETEQELYKENVRLRGEIERLEKANRSLRDKLAVLEASNGAMNIELAKLLSANGQHEDNARVLREGRDHWQQMYENQNSSPLRKPFQTSN